MNCVNHPDAPAVAYCRTCGKPLCNVCSRDVRSVVYCEECLASHLSGGMPAPGVVPPAVEPAAGSPRPVLAAILGLIPGVGAMYNGEFAKGFIHVLIFATLIWLTDHGMSIVGFAIAAFYIYMPIEAYKTARAKEMGLPPPDPFGFNHMFSPAPPVNRTAGAAPNVAPGVVSGGSTGGNALPDVPLPDEPRSRAPVGAFILIGLGVIFLLDELGLFNFNWDKFWPIILIVAGAAMLFRRRRERW